jgi:hypothetical protein
MKHIYVLTIETSDPAVDVDSEVDLMVTESAGRITYEGYHSLSVDVTDAKGNHVTGYEYEADPEN